HGTGEAGVERRRAAEEIARVSRDLSPGQRRFFDRIAEVQDGTQQDGAGGSGIKLGKIRPNG
ncbi:MAG: hypothetical protein WAM82_26765, partial [Thermoanaerobaculia bacterium]